MKTLKYAWRFLIRSKSYTLINLLGLSLSLACSIVLIRYIHREATADAHAIQPAHVAIPLRDIDGNVFPSAQKYMDTTYVQPENIVEEALFILMEKDNVAVQDKPYTANILVTDSTYFHFFHYELTTGSLQMSAPDDALVMESFARKVFGKENPIGKSIAYQGNKMATIRGVLKAPRCKTSYTFDVILNIGLQNIWGKMEGSFIRLQPGISAETINRTSNVYKKTDYGTIRNTFVPMGQFYWNESTNEYSVMEHHGSHSHLFLLAGVCLLVLLTGVINFINLYLVWMMKRSREYGIKKIFGIQGRALFVQLWIENMMIITCALFIAWVLVEVTAVPVNRLLESEISYTVFDIWLSLGIWLLLPLLTCIYPYLKYNYLPPIVGIRAISSTKQSVFTRLAFLFVQCVITFLLIILSLYFGKHLNFLLHTDPGFRQEGILVAQLQHESFQYGISDEERKDRYARIQQIKQKLDESPLITQWMPIQDAILDRESTINLINDKDVHQNMQVKWVSADFFSMYDLKVVEGELPDKVTDWTMQKVVMNESAMKAFGYKHSDEAFVRGESPLWMWVTADGERKEGGMELLPVEAVVKDYYAGHITAGKIPVVFMVSTSGGSDIQILCSPRKEKELMSYLRKVEKEIYGTEDFDYYWLKDKVSALYNKDRQVTGVYMFFAFIAIVISCLGLFGLSLFDIRRRYREIAIRKVNGAGVRDLHLLLLRKYVVVLAAAFIVAIPVAYSLINMYTRGFVIKTSIGIGIFVITLLIISIISLGTLAWQIRKATNINPAKIIKTE
ncbi:ABC transporter permease [Bacteroides sp.]|uniref:ABC transporter permease n=1 Tax=Bacteroides sp. TaxID=29523 RepID=UPI003AB879C8